MVRSPAWRRAAVLLGLALAALAPSTKASAHASLRASNPAAGAALDSPPETVVLTFTEPPEISLTSVEVVDASGRSFQRGPLDAAPGDSLTIRQGLETLPNGVYTVTWKVLSRADGHITAGAFAFGVGVSAFEAPPTPTRDVPQTPPASLFEIVSRWVLMVGLVVLLGSTATVLVAFGGIPQSVRWLAWGGWWVSLVGLVGLALAQREAAGAGFGALAGTSVGKALGWRAAAILIAGGALLAATLAGGIGRRAMIALAAVAVAAAMLAEAWGGHAAAAQSFVWAKVGAQWAHLAAVGVWIGGLAALLMGTRGATDERKAAAVRRFSVLAGGAVALVLVTGVVRAFNEVGSWGSLLSTGYGRGVLVKLGLLVVLIGLGAINRYRNVPRAGQTLSGLRRVSGVELGVAAVALATAALLAAIAPPRTIVAASASATRPGSVKVSGADFATSVRVRLEVDPGTAGPNRFVARIADYDSGAPVEGAEVSLSFSYAERGGVRPSPIELQAREPGAYEATGVGLSLDGRWVVTVVVQRGTDSAEVPLEIATRCRAEAFFVGPPTIWNIPALDGSVQGYVDPGTPGPNEVHFTYIDEAEIEIPLEGEPAISASRGGEAPLELNFRRLSPGHLVSKADLKMGRWRFQIVAEAGGDVLRACFEETLE